jgi:hypothetical protein
MHSSGAEKSNTVPGGKTAIVSCTAGGFPFGSSGFRQSIAQSTPVEAPGWLVVNVTDAVCRSAAFPGAAKIRQAAIATATAPGARRSHAVPTRSGRAVRTMQY